MAYRINMRRAPDVYSVLLFCLMYGFIQKCALCGELRCYVDFIETLICTCEAEHGSADELYELYATWSIDSDDDDSEHCNLTKSAKEDLLTTYECQMNMQSFSAGDTIRINMTKTRGGQPEESKECKVFNLNEIFTPYPPFNLSVSYSDGYNFSWNTKYESTEHYTLHGQLEYELSYSKKEDSWKNQRSVFTQVDRKNLLLVQSLFQGGTEYMSRVRAKPRTTSEYKGPWSEWSPPLVWRTDHDDDLTGKMLVLKSWLPTTAVCVVVLMALIFAYCHVPQRLWKKMSVLIPDPAPFFKPLYLGHDGDFKSWLGTSYTLATMDLFDWGVTLPDVMEVCSQQLSIHPTKEEATEVDEDHKSNACLPGVGVQRQEQSRFLIPCQSSISKVGAQSYGYVSSDTDTAAEFDEATPCSPQMSSFRVEVNYGVKVEGFPELNLEDQTSDLENGLSLADSPEQNKTYAQDSVLLDQSTQLGRCCTTEAAKHPLISLLEPNMSVLDLLLHKQADSWDDMVSQSYHSQDEVTYREVPYDSFSSNSGNGEEFGYPRMKLDLDTIDSGFADSECGSPVECEFDNNMLAQAQSALSLGSTVLGADNQHTRNYVKQWIADNSISDD
ncbi:interleukin-21 receptor isoform X1 [Pleurodeles waltl]|uniref:interleukin-21 receptor isoform X1 n=2 Tax=Pleurodeles waltl TaxID=8319 RepID=UPI003709471B